MPLRRRLRVWRAPLSNNTRQDCDSPPPRALAPVVFAPAPASLPERCARWTERYPRARCSSRIVCGTAPRIGWRRCTAQLRLSAFRGHWGTTPAFRRAKTWATLVVPAAPASLDYRGRILVLQAPAASRLERAAERWRYRTRLLASAWLRVPTRLEPQSSSTRLQ